LNILVAFFDKSTARISGETSIASIELNVSDINVRPPLMPNGASVPNKARSGLKKVDREFKRFR